jgi:Fe-S oxidoreductase
MSELEEKIKRIDNQGISKTPLYMRERLLKSLDVPLDRSADVAVITGCNALLRPLILVQLANILTNLNINFTFMSFEHCCFAEVVRDFIYRDDVSTPVYEDQARIWNRRNCTKARDLGARTVINLCAGCNTSYLRHAADLIRPVYYINYFRELPFSGHLDLNIDYYEGCHKKHSYYPECQAREESTLALLDMIEGLTYRRIPGSICCTQVPHQVLKRVGSSVLLAPSSCCYSNLRANNTDPKLNVISFIEILAKALAYPA